MKKNKLLIAIGAVVLVGIVSLFVYRSQNKEEPEGVTRIGAILPLTGSLGYEGTRMKNAMELALSQLPPEKRKLIRLNFEDGKFLARESISAFNKLNNSGTDVWIVFGDTPLLGMKGLLEKTAKPVLCLIGAQDLIKDSKWLFHFSGSITLPAVKCAEYAKANDIKSVGLIYLNEQIGLEVKNAFLESFKDADHKVISQDTFSMSDTSMKSLVDKAISGSPDALFVYGYSAPYIAILNEIKSSGFKGVVLTDGNLSAVKENLINGGEGYLYADFDFGDGCVNPETLNFINEMRSRFNVSASSFSAFAYEAIRVLADIIAVNGGTPESVHQGLLSVKQHHSIFGVVSYRENRELDIPILMKKATKDSAVVIE